MPPDESDHMKIDIRGMVPLIQGFDMPTSIAFYCARSKVVAFTPSKPAKQPDQDSGFGTGRYE
jgi:hypothetical protein